MIRKTHVPEAKSSLAFFVLGDLCGNVLYPLLLACWAVSLIWIYAHLGFFPPDQVKDWERLFCPVAGIEVGLMAYLIGAATPHLRETPKALLAYFRRFVRLIFMTELIVIPIHLAVFVLLRALHLNVSFLLPLTCLGLGWLILYFLTVRTFLWTPLPDEDRELVRGQDLEDEDEISWRAWFDD